MLNWNVDQPDRSSQTSQHRWTGKTSCGFCPFLLFAALSAMRISLHLHTYNVLIFPAHRYLFPQQEEMSRHRRRGLISGTAEAQTPYEEQLTSGRCGGSPKSIPISAIPCRNNQRNSLPSPSSFLCAAVNQDLQ